MEAVWPSGSICSVEPVPAPLRHRPEGARQVRGNPLGNMLLSRWIGCVAFRNLGVATAKPPVSFPEENAGPRGQDGQESLCPKRLHFQPFRAINIPRTILYDGTNTTPVHRMMENLNLGRQRVAEEQAERETQDKPDSTPSPVPPV